MTVSVNAARLHTHISCTFYFEITLNIYFFSNKIINCIISQSDLGDNYSFFYSTGVILIYLMMYLFTSDSFGRCKLNIMFCLSCMCSSGMLPSAEGG